MKRCPQCNRTYTDDALSFCLDDGSPLVSTSAPSSFDPGATVQYPQARDTTPPPTIAYPGQAPPPSAPPAWSPMPPQQTRKRSVWPWLLGIGAILVFVSIGVVILVFAITRMTIGQNSNSVNSGANRNRNANSNREVLTNTNTNGNSNTRSNLKSFTDDFSTQNWSTTPSQYGREWYQDEEYHMRASKGFYIVIYGPERDEYKTENATVRVGLRSISATPPSTGYGLVVHGLLKNDQLEDYAFVIYNGNGPKYKIVDQKGGKDTNIVEWTAVSMIRTGTTPNQLEVRIRGLKLDFYINGQFVTSITDTENYKTGRVGFYTSDSSEVAFDDLEISK